LAFTFLKLMLTSSYFLNITHNEHKQARGEHADARELASLYISKGVPIYPTPHGHSYHTIVWRMGIELENNNNSSNNANNEGGGEEAAGNREGNVNNNVQQEGGNNNENDINVIIDEALGNNNGNVAPNNNDVEDNNNRVSRGETGGGDISISRGETDAFYTDRYVEENGNNDRGSLFSRLNHSTYVEEKAIFCKLFHVTCIHCLVKDLIILTYYLSLDNTQGNNKRELT